METRSLIQVCRTLPWQMRGGMEHHAWQLAQAWRRRGWDVDVITTSFQDKTYTEERDGLRVHYLRHLPLNRNEIPQWRWWNQFAKRLEGYGKAKKIRADVVHVESLYGGAWFRYLRKHQPTTVRATTVHGTGLQVYRDSARAQLLSKVSKLHPRAVGQWATVALRARVERRRELPSAHRVIAVSDQLAEHLQRDYQVPGSRLDVIPNGVAAPHRPDDREKLRQRLGLPTDLRLLLYLGRIEASKGLDRLLPHLQRNPRDRLVVAGTGSDEQRLRTLGTQLSNEAQIRFLGEVPDDLKQRLLVAADVLVLPSESEGQPIVLLEALAAGTPAYTTRPWVPQGVRDLIATGDDVSAGIEAALGKTAQVRGAAERVARDFSWDRIAQRYEAVFERARTG